MLDSHVFNSDDFFTVSEARNAKVSFVEQPQIKVIIFLKSKHGYLIKINTKLFRVELLIG